MSNHHDVALPAWTATVTSEMGTVRPCDVVVKEEVQRRFRSKWAATLAARFDPTKVGVVTINIRNTGERVQVDGMHRFEAARIAGFGETPFHANVYKGLTEAQEAELFLALNDNKQVPATDLFRIGRKSGEPAAVGVQTILDKYGLEVSYPAARNNFSAVHTAMKLWRESPAALNAAFGVLIGAWQDGKANAGLFNAELLHGATLVIMSHGDGVDRERFANVLRGYPGGPQALMGYIRSRRQTHGGSAAAMAALVFRELYNKGLRKNQLLTEEEPGRKTKEPTTLPDITEADLLPPPVDSE
jgi:hypothetical protein